MKKIVVLGGGISGYGSAILARKMGFDVFLSDSGRLADRFRMKLEAWGVPYEEGGHTEERVLAASEVIKSPGIPETAPLVCRLRERGVPVISEIEFAGRYLDGAKTICITGSNGKTTTTSLIYKILHDAGYRVALGGNIGESFAYSVATGRYDWYVLELSSFQLDGMYRFRADIGVLTNITPDHLDRYDHSFAKYAAAKMRITQNQRPTDCFIYSADDETIWSLLPEYRLPMRQLPFAARTVVAGSDGDAFLSSSGRFTATVGDRSVTVDTRRMRISGLHNAYNAMAAALAALAAGVAPDRIRRSICTFAPVEHRLEPVATVKGVRFINDSKATNVNSCWYALESMERPVVLILGGKDKGNDYREIEQLVREKVKAIVCLGVDNRKLHDFFDGMVPYIADAHSMQEAVELSYAAAQQGDVVLLSPCCASFDLFKSYEDRGRQFKECVRRL